MTSDGRRRRASGDAPAHPAAGAGAPRAPSPRARSKAPASIEQALDALIPILPNLLFLVGEDDRIVDYRGGSGMDPFAPPAQFLGRRPDEILPEPAASTVRHALAHARATGAPVVVEYPLPDPAGERYFEARLVPLRTGAVLTLVADITARRDAEAALRASEARFRALIEKSSDLLTVTDEKGTVTFVNPTAAETLGYEPGEIVGRPVFDFVHPDDLPRAMQAFGEMREQPGATRRMELRTRHRDGSTRVYDCVGRSLFTDPAVKGLVIHSRNATEERRLEEQFHQAQKLESVGRLAGGVAHDFNNLLTAILGYADLLEANADKGETDVEAVREIRRAGERARDLTRQLLTFARKQLIEPRPLDLNALVRDLERLLQRLLGEDIELETRFAAGLWPIFADPGQLEQVILNLAVNARDAMKRGGTLVLETANAELDESHAAIHADARPGAHVLLVVKDTGEGMTPETQAHLFEPFFTTKPPGEGTGLGLATVYGIVKQSGGHIRVTSAPGVGTTFELYFPRGSESPVAEGAAAAAVTRGGTEAVLLVEDDPSVRELAALSLRSAGYEVLVASNGREALEVARRGTRSIHLLLTDVVMPGMSGRQLAESLTREQPSMRVLFMSGYTRDTIVRHGMLEPGVAFLAKPFTPTSLLVKAREVLDARRGRG